MRRNGRGWFALQHIGDGQRRGVVQGEQDVVLLLADAAAEHRKLDRRLGAGQVPLGLAAADQPPVDGAVQLPPALGGVVRRDAAAGRVARHQVGALTEPAHRKRRPEPPGLGAQPAQVLPRVAAVDQLPVQHPVQSFGCDHQVAGAEVAVHQRVSDRSGLVLGQPAQPDLDRGPGLAVSGVHPGQLAEGVVAGQARDDAGIDVVDPGQDLPEPVCQPGPDGGVGLVPEQPPGDRLPVQMVHQQVGLAQGARPVVVQVSHWHAGFPGRDHGRRLRQHAAVVVADPAVGVAEQDQAASGAAWPWRPRCPSSPGWRRRRAAGRR